MHQWGFQRAKSTVPVLLHTTHDWLEHLEKGAKIGAVFFDYKKAFDSVPHFPLLSKLEAIGLDQCSRDNNVLLSMACHVSLQVLPQGYHKVQS